MARFSDEVIAAIRKSLVLGIRAGGGTHKIIGIWAVVVERRVFIRSWGLKAGGWYATFLAERRGVMRIDDRIIPVRAVRTRSERLKAAVDEAYAAKYHTKGSMRWVQDLKRTASRDSTMELVPLE
ncbi:MAG TPA: DUF2255 family protein [Thermoanaerobaculia bacterium]|jgi:hypothetical protein|nr:DUF2255 family protein [Thermoanaerobaculia bacterium]